MVAGASTPRARRAPAGPESEAGGRCRGSQRVLAPGIMICAVRYGARAVRYGARAWRYHNARAKSWVWLCAMWGTGLGYGSTQSGPGQGHGGGT
eukprot:150752-Rhodomonas_salina.1